MILKIVPDVVPRTRPLILSGSSPASDAARLMRQHDAGAVLVVDDDDLRGIFTERDVSFRVIAAGYNPQQVTLEKVMTPDPRTVKAGDTVLSALEIMEAGHFRHLPVADNGEMVGVVAMRDVLYGTNKQIARELQHMSVDLPDDCRIVSDIMSNNILVTLEGDASVSQASELMKSYDIGAVVILRDNRLAGIFTERDVSFRVVAEGLDPDTIRLDEVMSADLVTISAGESCQSVVEKMQKGNFRHLPIMQDNRVAGILSIRDLFSYIRHKLETSFQNAMISRSRNMMASD